MDALLIIPNKKHKIRELPHFKLYNNDYTCIPTHNTLSVLRHFCVHLLSGFRTRLVSFSTWFFGNFRWLLVMKRFVLLLQGKGIMFELIWYLHLITHIFTSTCLIFSSIYFCFWLLDLVATNGCWVYLLANASPMHLT